MGICQQNLVGLVCIIIFIIVVIVVRRGVTKIVIRVGTIIGAAA